MLHGEYKEPGQKLVAVDLEVTDGLLAKVSVSGDFFMEPDETIFTINEALLGLPARSSIAHIKETVTEALPADALLMGLTPFGIAIATHRAIYRAVDWREMGWEIIMTPESSPAFNVSLDEVLAKEVGEGRRGPTVRFWNWNSDAIIIGSFQSVLNEVDSDEAAAVGAQVIRRISGGGAMYMQSDASISYSLYVPQSFVSDLSFEESYFFFDAWIVEALNALNISAEYIPLNDIAGPTGKIGGAAQKRFASGSLLHHATLAYDMDGELMNRVLRIGQEKILDKGIRSAAKRVDPLKSQTGLSRRDLIEKFVESFKARNGGTFSNLTEFEIDAAKHLLEEKFLTKEWTHRVP